MQIVHHAALSQAQLNNGVDKSDALKTAGVVHHVTLQRAKANNEREESDTASTLNVCMTSDAIVNFTHILQEERDVNTAAKAKRYYRYLALLRDDVTARHEEEERRVSALLRSFSAISRFLTQVRLVPKQDETEKVSLARRVWREVGAFACLHCHVH